MRLTLVTDEGQIRRSLRTFNAQAEQNRERARKLLYQTIYWVYDPDHAAFGPSKFVGFADMDFRTYEWVLAEKRAKRKPPGDRHNGYVTRTTIESVLGCEYAPSARLSRLLRDWAHATLGEGTLTDKDGSDWRFIELSPTVLASTSHAASVGSVGNVASSPSRLSMAEDSGNRQAHRATAGRIEPERVTGRQRPPSGGIYIGELGKCRHGVLRIKICAICEPERFRRMYGDD